MASSDTLHSTTKQMDAVKSVWHQLRTDLEEKKSQLYDQIGHYPTPITGCDQQFNHLLDEQRRVLNELARLTEAEKESLTAVDPSQVIEAFIRASAYSDVETVQSPHWAQLP